MSGVSLLNVITDPKMENFVESKVSNEFNLTVDQVAKKCKNWGRFKEWLNSDETRIKEVLNKVKDNGVSPSFFASYEKSEGYNSKWGWLNRTHINGNPLQDADSVSKWVVSQSNSKDHNPAWIDAGNPVDFVPNNVKESGNEHFSNMKTGTIGRVVIAGTAAATWAVYYPNGLKKEYNKIQDYADPITVMYETIEEWGGKIEGGDDPSPDPDPDPDPPEIDFSGILSFFNNFSENLIENIEKMLIVNLYDYGKSKTFGNTFLKVDKTYSNMYKIKPTLNFSKIIDDILNNGLDQLHDIIGGLIPSPDPDPDPDPDGEMFFPIDYTVDGINFWHPPYTPGSTQEAMDFGGPRSGGRIHAGYDIGSGGVTGIKVYAIRSGEITFVGNEGTRGFVIRIKHSSDDKHTMYMHLVVNSNAVKVGDKVKAGQHIATMGDTPSGVYSIHLHVELDKTGKFEGYEKQLNPREYLKVTGNNKTSLPNPAKQKIT